MRTVRTGRDIPDHMAKGLREMAPVLVLFLRDLPVPGETSVGGAGDGNFVAALGRPVLDGLGAVGGGAHARHEHVLLDHVPARTALLAGLLTAYAK